VRFTYASSNIFAAGETGSITLVSERVYISQPSISTAISHLERELGVQLFIRHHAQGLSLTPVFGCVVTVASMLAPELAHSFTEAYPATPVRLVEGNQKELLEGLRRSEVDIALTYDLQIPDDIEFSPLARLPPHVLLSDIHPLAQRSALTLQELESEPLILLDLPLSRGYFLSLFMKEGLSPNIVIGSAHQEVIRTMVANGHGYSLFNVRPRSDYALDGRKVVRVRLAGDHRPMIVGSATLKGLAQTQAGAGLRVTLPSLHFPTTTSLEWWRPNTTRGLPAARSNMLDDMRLVSYIRRVAPESPRSVSVTEVFNAATIGGARSRARRYWAARAGARRTS
jgi:DNA-binding transcriptional LysR family regulator